VNVVRERWGFRRIARKIQLLQAIRTSSRTLRAYPPPPNSGSGRSRVLKTLSTEDKTLCSKGRTEERPRRYETKVNPILPFSSFFPQPFLSLSEEVQNLQNWMSHRSLSFKTNFCRQQVVFEILQMSVPPVIHKR
jgi:hypothetical protein